MMISDAKHYGRRQGADTNPVADAGYLESIPAAFRLENSVFSALSNTVERAPFDPEYDPISKIPTNMKSAAGRYVNANSDAEIQSITEQINREQKDRDLISRAGGDGILALLTAGVFDPINFIPVGGVAIKTAKTGQAALRTAQAGAATTAVTEGVLQATQETRTGTESAIAITAGTFLGGLLGAGAHALSKQMSAEGLIRPIDEIEDNVSRSMGAAEVTEMTQEAVIAGGRDVQMALKIQNVVDPSTRLLTSPVEETAKFAEKLYETPLRLSKNEHGIATEQNAEAIARSYDSGLFQFLRGIDDDYTQYAIGRNKRFGDKVVLGAQNMAGADRLSFNQFKEAVGRAARRDDSAQDLPIPDAAKPHVESAAKRFRVVAEKLKNDAIDAGLLPDDVSVETALSYLNRVYRTERLSVASERMKFRQIVTEWLRRENPEMTEGEMNLIAEDVLMRIESIPDGRLGRDVDDVTGSSGKGGKPNAKKGAFKQRSFLIPDELIEDFLEDDIEYLARALTRNMAPDIGLAKAFDTTDVNLSDQINEIRRAWESKMEDAGGSTAKLKKQMDRDIEDFAAVRDRIRGVFGQPKDPKHLGPRAAQSLRTLNYVRLLGGMTISALPDLARPVMVHGVSRVFGDAIVPLLTNIRGMKGVTQELKDMGVVAEMLNNTRAQAFADLSDNMARRSGVEKGLGSMGDTFGMVSLMSPWNDALKSVTGAVTQSRLIRAVRAEAGGNIDDSERLFLRENGIGADVISDIARQISSYGSRIKNLELSGWSNWDNQVAKDLFEQAINRETRKTIVTPGQDRALIAVGGNTLLDQSTEFGKMAVQFKAFGIAAGQRMMISGLQNKDMNTLNGVMLTVAMGMITYGIKEKLAGRDLPDPNENMGKWVIEGVDRSGMLGWLTEPNNILEKMTRGQVGLSALAGDQPMSRYASRSIPEAILGPSLGLMGDLAGAASGVATAGTGGDSMTKGDVHTLRKVLPYQNVFYLRWLFDQMEETATEAVAQ